MVLGRGVMQTSALQAIQAAYGAGQTDEFIEPVVITKDGAPIATVNDNDAIIFFNFRIDRPRQLTMAFVLPDFENLQSFKFSHDPYTHVYQKQTQSDVFSGTTFQRGRWPQNIFFVTMTEYQKNLPVSAIAYPPFTVEAPMAQVLSDRGLRQLHLAESEKERMVTFYFDGMREDHFSNEEVIIEASPKVSTYDKKPEMSLWKVVDTFLKQLELCQYQFFVLNFANPDMVAHSGKIEATIKAIENIDKAMGKMEEAILSRDGIFAITSDHGNCEEMLRYPTTTFYYTSTKGEVDTEHSSNPVPFVIVGRQFQGKGNVQFRGTLADIAPTLLSLMNIPIPEQMSGKVLFGAATGAAPV
jgi:2,3-bisphosphoglycerate-independent phosphoglycerate mutase